MRRFRTQLLFLFSTFFVGVAAYYICNFSPASVKETNLNAESSSVTSVQVPEKQKDEPKTSEFYPVSPCENTNSYEYRREWKAKGTISVGVLNARVLCGILPETEGNVSGIVKADVLIDETGKVLEVQVENQLPLLQKAIVRAARQTRFEPYMLRGDAHKARGIIMYEFDDKGGVQLYKFKRSG